MAAWRYEISLLMKKIFHSDSFAAGSLVKYILSTLEEKSFVSPRGHAISSISLTLWGRYSLNYIEENNLTRLLTLSYLFLFFCRSEK